MAGFALALVLAACTDDAIVYPNRNLQAGGGSATNVGDAGDAGEVSGGSSGKGGSAGGGGVISKAGGGGSLEEEDAGTGGMMSTGPVCGDGKIEAPEDCEDGNIESGDGCSADCVSSCEECEKHVCPLFDVPNDPLTDSAYHDCYELPGTIMTGPAMGYTRAEVCRELVDCVRQEECSQTIGPSFVFRRCWCDTDWTFQDKARNPVVECSIEPDFKNPTDPTKFVPGKCATLFQDGAESAKLSDVISNFYASELPEGAANRLLAKCDARVCTEECLPKYFKQPGLVTITADILSARNTAGESPLGDLIADAQRAIAQADIALVENSLDGRVTGLLYAATAHRAADAPGRVLRSELLGATIGYSTDSATGLDLSPYDNRLFKVNLTGQKIYDVLEQQLGSTAEVPVGTLLYVSGITYSWDGTKPAASRLIEVRKDGNLLDKAATFTVVLGNRLALPTGRLSAIAGAPNAVALTDVDPIELLGEYLSQLPQPVAPPLLNRITRLN